MADPDPSPVPPDSSEDATVREEWQKLERQRIDEEIAEAREDAEAAATGRGRPSWLVWLAFAVALAAGIAVTLLLNRQGGSGR